MSAQHEISDSISLPLPVAVWVLSAHFYALVIPLVLVWAVSANWEYVTLNADMPYLFFVAVALMMAGSAFEIAQNSIDKWYLKPEQGSVNGVGFCDMLFYWFVVASQAAVAIACKGDWWWMSVLVGLLALVFPVFYLKQWAPFRVLGLLGLISLATAYLSFFNPVILLQLGLTPMTMFFFGLLLKTGAQQLHGFTTSSAASGVVFLAWGIVGAAAGEMMSWWMLLGIVATVAIVLTLLRPVLEKLPTTPLPEGR
jgi:hypothetical protein